MPTSQREDHRPLSSVDLYNPCKKFTLHEVKVSHQEHKLLDPPSHCFKEFSHKNMTMESNVKISLDLCLFTHQLDL